jgi:hypothetical protein
MGAETRAMPGSGSSGAVRTVLLLDSKVTIDDSKVEPKNIDFLKRHIPQWMRVLSFYSGRLSAPNAS